MTIDTFLANAKRAVRDRETVSIGGGEFSPAEINTVIQAITMLRDNAYVLTDSDNAFVQSYNDSFGVFANKTVRKYITDLNASDWNESLCRDIHGSDFSSFLDAYKLWKSAVDFARNQNNLSNNIAEHMKTTYRTCPKCPHGLGFKCKKCWPN